MPNKKEKIKQNSKLSDEELENTSGGCFSLEFFYRPRGTYYILDAKEAGVEKEEKCLWGVLDDRGHVLYRTSDLDEASNFALKIGGHKDWPNNDDDIYEVRTIWRKKDLQKLRRKARIKHFFHL